MVEMREDEIEAIRTDVERIALLAESVRHRLVKLSGEEEILEPPDREKQRLELWGRIYDAGGVVNRETLHTYTVEAGYDPRGLAGFFKGKGSLIWVGKPGEGKVALATWASEEVEIYRDWLDAQTKKRKRKK